MSRTIEYMDAQANCRGYLVYDREECRVAAGGCRVQPGLTRSRLAELAGLMTLKQRVLRVHVDGAKCGLDLDPAEPDSTETLGRFVEFLADELRRQLSMGCDMGTRWEQLERMARNAGVPSIKYSLMRAQSLTESEFFARHRLLDQRVGPFTLGQRRAGHALAYAARVAAARVATGTPRIALQGFGNLGRGAVCAFAEWGTTVVAVADEQGCAHDDKGLDVWRMLASPTGSPIGSSSASRHRDTVLTVDCDVLVLAATEDALTEAQAGALRCAAVVVGANGGLRASVEEVLVQHGVLVVPDFLGGIGGSASMEVLFGAPWCLEGRGVLDAMEVLLSGVLGDVLDTAERDDRTPRQAGLEMAAAVEVDPDAPPYGHNPYLRPLWTAGRRSIVAGAGW
jgi:glutamate dehydrogenase (NAD(P)+)